MNLFFAMRIQAVLTNSVFVLTWDTPVDVYEYFSPLTSHTEWPEYRACLNTTDLYKKNWRVSTLLVENSNITDIVTQVQGAAYYLAPC